MRNLKRALSLALASVMLLGMMVVGSSAKGLDDFSDASEIVNQDAVAVTSAIGMFEGYEDGSFKPENVVTRAEMAVIICTMLYGAGVNVDPFAETSVFTDVPAWAEGYVNLCSSLGIVAGVGDGKFDPNATVTTAQAVLMLCRALGYFQSAADFGDNWMLAATAKGTNLGLYGDLKLTAEAGLTRDNVAELVFNALTKAVPVQYNELLGVYYNENKGIIYSLTFYYTDTLGYKNFDLVYRTNENTDYGRPGITWGTGSYRGTSATTEGNDAYGLNEDGSLKPENVKMTSDDEIITIANTPDFVYTANTKQNVVYKDVGKSVVDDYTWEAYVDGTEQDGDIAPENDRDTNYAYTAKGATTEIYVDDVNETVTVVKINYYMGEVTNIREDDDGEYATVRVLSKDTDDLSDVVDDRNIYCTGFAEDDYVVITVDVDEDGDSFIASIADPEAVEGTVTRVSKDADPEQDKGSYARLDDGTEYTYSVWTAGDLDDLNEKHPTLDIEYRLLLDPNGYVIGFQALENYYDNYLYVEAVDVTLNTITAKVVFTDGTSKTVEIDNEYIDTDSDTVKFDADNDKTIEPSEYNWLAGNVYAWTESNEVYTLRQILDLDDANSRPNSNRYKDTQDQAEGNGAGENATGAVNIYNDAAFIQAPDYTYIVDENTAFVDTDEKVLYTGFENVPDYIDEITNDAVKFWAIDSNGDDVVDVVFIYGGEATNDNKTYFYVADTGAYETYNKNKMYKEQDLFIDGEKTTLVFNAAAHNEITTDGLYCVERTNGEGIVTDITFINGFSTVYTVGTRTFALDTNRTHQYTTDGDTIFVVVTYDLKTNKLSYKTADIDTGALKDMEDDDDYNTYVYVAKDSNSGRTADLVYIVKTEIGLIAEYEVDYTVPATVNFTLTDEDGKTVKDGAKVQTGDKLTATFSAKDPAADTVVVKVNGTPIASGDEVTVGNTDVNFTFEVNAVQYAGLSLVFNQNARVTIDGKTYSNNTNNIKLVPGQEYAVQVAYASNVDDAFKSVDLDGYAQSGYGDTYYLTLSASDPNVLTIGVEMFELTLLDGISASWTYGNASGSIDAGEAGEVPAGAAVTLSGATLRDSEGTAAVTAFTMTGDTALADEDYGYVQVTLQPTTNDAIATLTSEEYVKANKATTIEGTMKVANGSAWTTARTFTLTVDGTTVGSAEGTGELTSDTLSFSVAGVTLTKDSTVVVSWT